MITKKKKEKAEEIGSWAEIQKHPNVKITRNN
jgi:hypothetical protein